MNKIEDGIIKVLQCKKTSQMSEKELIDFFNINDNEKQELTQAIKNLSSRGKIFLNEKNKYIIFPSNKDLKQGTLKIDYSGKYFISNDNNNIFIPNDCLNGAIKDDIVLVKVKDKNTIFVKEIIERENKSSIFECVMVNGEKKIRPYGFPFYGYIKLNNRDLKNLVDGDIILIDLEKDSIENTFEGKVITNIGHRDDPDLNVKTIATQFGIKLDFNEEVKKELEKIPNEVTQNELNNRVSFLDKQTFTIDGIDTKDIDDAVSIEKNEKGNYILGVHIADVHNYVKTNSAIFKAAYERGNSYYLGNSVFAMIAHKLSNGICSLNENEIRLTKSVLMEYTPEGKLVNYEIIPKSYIKSSKKMDYDSVNKVLNGKDITSYEKYKDDLFILQELTNQLIERRKKRGQINIDNYSIKIITNKLNIPIDIKVIKRGMAEKIIEQSMLSANETVLTDLYNKSLEANYRVHDLPDKEKLYEIFEYLKLCGYKIKAPNNVDNPYVLQGILDKLKTFKEYPILSDMITQCMKKAGYSPNNIGHFGIGINCEKGEAYGHFTSPIRRFMDLLLHILIDKYYCNEEIHINDLSNFIKNACKHCSETEIIADKAEREVKKSQTAQIISQNIGKHFHGFITYVSKKGLTVMTDDYITGKININDLGENYKFNPNTITLYNNDNEYHIGQEIDLIAKQANMTTGKILFKTINKNMVRAKK